MSEATNTGRKPFELDWESVDNITKANLTEIYQQTHKDLLEANGITANKNGVPGDTRGFVETSGVRIGVAAETTRGHDEAWFKALAERMIKLLRE